MLNKILGNYNKTMLKSKLIGFIYFIYQDGFPQRPKGMHFLNMPAVLESIYMLMRSFAKDKMKERMIVRLFSKKILNILS